MTPGPGHRSVVAMVVTYNSTAVIDSLLATLDEGMAGCDWRLVVVDSGSTDGSPDHVRAVRPDAEVVELGRNLGYAAGINAVLRRHPDAGAYLVLNPDVRLTPGSARQMVDALDRHGAGVTAPRELDGSGRLTFTMQREPTIRTAIATGALGRLANRLGVGDEVADASRYDRVTDAEWITGAILCISGECQREVGAWDESFFLYSEETDLCLRARDAGYRVVLVPTAAATHLQGDSRRSAALWGTLVVNKVRLYRRRHGVLRGAVFWLVVLVSEGVRAALGRDISKGAVRALLSERHQLDELRRARAAEPAYVCFAGNDWWYHNRGHSDFQLALHVARHRDVLLVNSLGIRMPKPGATDQAFMRLLRKARSTLKLLRRPVPELPRFRVLSPFVLPLYGSARGRRLSAAIVRAQVRVVCRFLGIRQPVMVVTIPTALPVVEGVPHRTLVFNRADRYSAFGEADTAVIAELERGLLTRADHVVYVSHRLMEIDAAHVGDRGVFLDHGVDLDLFTRREGRPPDIADITTPVIGFFGALEDYVVDFSLLEHVAVSIPEATLLLIGDAPDNLDAITRHPNVRWIGYRPLAEIPSYGSCFDVALMPWNRNEWIDSCNPIKMKEYLALGLAVVSTPFPEVHRYAHLIDVAGTPDEFVAAVRRCLAGQAVGTPAARRDAVRGDTWAQRGLDLIGIAEGRPPVL